MKFQSAMEYLMTYGWAILIIAVVLVILFYLGVFNPEYAAPKAAPGTCTVYRPQGPGTTAEISLSGTCNVAVPQFATQFNGASSYITVADNSNLDIVNAISLCAWMDPSSYPSGGERILSKGTGSGGTNSVYYLYIDSSGKLHMAIDDVGSSDVGYSIPATNMWYFVCGTYDGNNRKLYVNGIQEYSIAQSGTINTNSQPLTIGASSGSAGSEEYSGMLGNIQIYSTALSANSVVALYQEGIGGAPIDLQDLAGWWPLNGNANDYSGNANNGVASGISFNGNWWGVYTAP